MKVGEAPDEATAGPSYVLSEARLAAFPARKTYDPAHVVEALRTTGDLRDISKLDKNVRNTIALAFPHKKGELLEELDANGFVLPSRWVMSRCRARLDAAMCLHRRDVNRDSRNVTRQLMFDASQIDGVEIFAVREVIVRNSDTAALQHRILPVVSLGAGHFTLEDKSMALCHSICLETGFDIQDANHFQNQV